MTGIKSLIGIDSLTETNVLIVDPMDNAPHPPAFEHTGGCHCGAIRYRLRSAKALTELSPRACQCDFCAKHGATYISDAGGALTVTFAGPDTIAVYRQGSKNAEFVICKRCGVLTTVFCAIDGHRYGVVNSRTLDDAALVTSAQPILFDTISADARRQRWQEIWIGDITLSHPLPSPARLDEQNPDQ